MGHIHATLKNCDHELKYCPVRDVVFCERCEKEWTAPVENYTVSYPNYTITYPKYPQQDTGTPVEVILFTTCQEGTVW